MSTKRRAQFRAQAGITLIEVLMASGLMATALGAVAMMSSKTEDAYQTASAALRIEQNLHGGLQRAAMELTTTGTDHLNPPNPVEGIAFSTLDFQRVIGNTGGVPDLGSLDRLALELADGEVDDGLDNDSDGLIDEQELVFRTNVGTADEKRVVLCNHVLEYIEGEMPDGADNNGNLLEDEGGFHFVRSGNILTLRLSAGGFDHTGHLIVRTSELSVRMRN
ncbi:MAG: hypothetical protein ACI841_004758 [Planctomycetota bacterium]|jgi:hypothetical protein